MCDYCGCRVQPVIAALSAEHDRPLPLAVVAGCHQPR
jgi:hypothetical protein